MTTPYLTVPEVCKILRKKKPTAPQYIMWLYRRGDIKAKKVLGQWLTTEEWVKAFVEGQKAKEA